ncbi:MAG TPA: orotate phosphoribosyltransferase [Gemmatimonadales bacterium]
MTDRERLLRLLKTRSVQRGDFILSSGGRSSFYIDARLTTMSAEGLLLVGRVGLEAIRARGWKPAAVGGLTLGADPVAYAIAAASVSSPPLVDAFSVRKEPKGHGAQRRIEGNLPGGGPVVVVEDVITTGASTISAIEAVEAEGAVVLGVLAVVDREERGREAVERKCSVVVITTISELGLRPTARPN